MTTPPARTSGWTQPNPPGADQNLHTIHRKFANTHRPVTNPTPTTPDKPPISPSTAPPAEEAEQHPADPPAEPSDAAADVAAPADAETVTVTVTPDTIEQANERRIAKQWEDVVARLCRDFAPAGGADRKRVLAQIAQQRVQLDSATVRDYLPVLVDRAVRRIYAPDDPVQRGPGSSAR